VITSPDKEPWAFGTTFEQINRETINLRYRFLPYIYTVMEEASRTGIPAMRPMVFSYPDDPAFIWNADEFMFGGQLLVAPVLWPGDTTRDVQLPKGIWYDYWSNQKLEGGRQVKVSAPVDRLPIFVKAGATIPTQDVLQFSDQTPSNPIAFTVYPSAISTSGYYEDDATSFAYEKGVYSRRSFDQKVDSRGITFTISRSQGSFVPAARSLTIRFVDVEFRPSRVTLDEKELGNSEWSYDSASRILQIKTDDSNSERRIRVSR
jgi:alpha-glucosidase